MSYLPNATEMEQYRLRMVEAERKEAVVPLILKNGRPVGWQPQTGSQEHFLKSPFLEVLYHGTRGPGKTDALIFSFAGKVGKGYGPAWRGILFRQTYPQLADIEVKTKKWFKILYGDNAKFNEATKTWKWSTGEQLLLRHMRRPEDYWNYHGHEYPWQGWEELTNWADDRCFLSMFACCRSSHPGVPRMIRCTTNPYGVGHNWVKERYNLHGQWWVNNVQLSPKGIDGTPEPARAAIHGHISENRILLDADPHYVANIVASADNPAMMEAWLDGSWDIVAGGMFDDVWRPDVHIIDPFPIPRSWRLDRSFDWGSSAPFSVGWWAESDGTDVQTPRGTMSTVRGDLFRVAEWYGWNGKANKGLKMLATDIAAGIVDRELRWGLLGKVVPGPADSSIFDVENGMCIANDMAMPVRVQGQQLPGVVWERADKSPGSRKTGWEQMRKMFKASVRPKIGVREQPGLFVFRSCDQFVRTVPVLPRKEKDMDDVDKDAEDHVGDEVRYRVRFDKRSARTGVAKGLY